jgi:uncharacterized alpha/beta hydrolase family protein
MNIFIIIGTFGGIIFLGFCIGFVWLTYEEQKEEKERMKK